MKRLVTLFFLIFASCGGELTPCERADTNPQGLCVIMHEDFEVNDFILARILYDLELDMNDAYPDDKVNIADLFRKHEASLEYVKYIDRDASILGTHTDGLMKSLVGGCWLHYWVPAHEAIHFWAQYHLGVPRITNATHQVVRGYIKWAEAENMSKIDTVEWQIAKTVANYCGVPYRFLPEDDFMQVDDALGE